PVHRATARLHTHPCPTVQECALPPAPSLGVPQQHSSNLEPFHPQPHSSASLHMDLDASYTPRYLVPNTSPSASLLQRSGCSYYLTTYIARSSQCAHVCGGCSCATPACPNVNSSGTLSYSSTMISNANSTC